jgi:hypothetical protein
LFFRPDGKLRYANNSNYKGDNMIRKEVFVNEGMLEQVAPDKPRPKPNKLPFI